MAQIYGLADRESGEIRYIGKANSAQARLKTHMRDASRRDYPLYRWIRKHGSPDLVILIDDSQDWCADERRLIAEARASGDRLLNVADGGDEPWCPRSVLRDNGRKSAKHRPKNIMRVYRIMESNIRSIRKNNPVAAQAIEAKFEMFKERISRARVRGRLWAVDEALGIWLTAK